MRIGSFRLRIAELNRVKAVWLQAHCFESPPCQTLRRLLILLRCAFAKPGFLPIFDPLLGAASCMVSLSAKETSC